MVNTVRVDNSEQRRPSERRMARVRMPVAGLLVAVALVASACGAAEDLADSAVSSVEETVSTVEEVAPTEAPTDVPTAVPTAVPTEVPIEVPTEAPAEPAETTDASAVADDTVLATGAEVFAVHCARCHGDDGAGTNQGKPLLGVATTHPDPEHQIGIVTNGKGRMPGFAEKLTIEEIDALVTYIRASF